jgi:hypothetical protein
MIVGLLGFLLARGGISLDLLCTAADTLRTLAMLGVIVFGCFMVMRPNVQPALPPRPEPRNAVVLSQQQFQTLLSLASATQLALPTIIAEPVATPATPATPVTPATPATQATPTEPTEPTAPAEPATQATLVTQATPTEPATEVVFEEKTTESVELQSHDAAQ